MNKFLLGGAAGAIAVLAAVYFTLFSGSDCGRADIQDAVLKNANQSATAGAESLTEMLITGLGDSRRQDQSGKTKVRTKLQNVRTETTDRTHRVTYCSAQYVREYYIQFANGSTEERGERTRMSKITYQIEYADNGAASVAKVGVE